ERLKLENLVSLYGLSDVVTFTGGLSNPETAVADFDLFAISSDTEQMPLSVLESMAAGLPVASTDLGDIRSMGAPDNAPYIVHKDATSLAQAMQKLIREEGLRRRIGAANQARAVAEYDEARMFSAYENLFAGRAPSPPLSTTAPN